MNRNWTKNELQILNQCLSDGKSYADIAKILNRPVNGVALKAQRLNRAKNGLQREQKAWTVDEINILKQYLSQNKSAKIVAKELNRTEASVILKARKMGLYFRGKNTLCRDDELVAIREDWQDSFLTLKGIAKKYNRSPEAIKILAQRNNFGARQNYYSDLTISDICDCLDVSRDRVSRWIKDGLLKAHSKKIGKSQYKVSLDDFLEFMELHQDLYNGKNVDKYIFPYELPEWFKKKYTEDSKQYATNWHKEYTDAEDRRILDLYEHGKSISEIACILHRTESGIRTRLTVLCAGRIAPKYYTDNDIRILKQYADSETLYEIQKRLKTSRSIKSLQYKCESLGIKYHLSKTKCK